MTVVTWVFISYQRVDWINLAQGRDE